MRGGNFGKGQRYKGKKTKSCMRNRHLGPHSAASNKIRKYIVPICIIFTSQIYTSQKSYLMLARLRLLSLF